VSCIEYRIAARNGYYAGYHGEPMRKADEWPVALQMVWLNNWEWGRQQREEDRRGGVLVVVVRPDDSPQSLIDRFCEWCFGK